MKLKTYFKDFKDNMEAVSEEEILKAIDILKKAHTVYLIGNGGSSAIASHFANDLNKIAKIPAICLSDNTPTFSAYANDVGYEYTFSEQIKNFMHPPDVLVAISSSGTSPNIVRAVREAQKRRCKVIGFVGFKGGTFTADAKIYVSSDDYGIIEPLHDAITHFIIKHL